jgi:hypothetical protein
VEALAGPRGTDKRLADSLRLTRAERNARYAARRDGGEDPVLDAVVDPAEVLVDEYGNPG